MANVQLTKREYFAAVALQGLVAGYSTKEGVVAEAAAQWAVELADALIKQLDKAEPYDPKTMRD